MMGSYEKLTGLRRALLGGAHSLISKFIIRCSAFYSFAACVVVIMSLIQFNMYMYLFAHTSLIQQFALSVLVFLL